MACVRLWVRGDWFMGNLGRRQDGHGIAHLVARRDHEAREAVGVWHEAEEEGGGDGLEGVVVWCWRGGGGGHCV